MLLFPLDCKVKKDWSSDFQRKPQQTARPTSPCTRLGNVPVVLDRVYTAVASLVVSRKVICLSHSVIFVEIQPSEALSRICRKMSPATMLTADSMALRIFGEVSATIPCGRKHGLVTQKNNGEDQRT